MNPVLKRIYETGLAEDADGEEVDVLSPSVPKQEGRALHDAIVQGDLDSTLEVGFAYGISTLWILDAHDEKGAGHHEAIDPNQPRYHDIGLLNVERAGLKDRFTFHDGPSETVMPRMVEEDRRFDLVFIDGHHRFDHVLVDLFFADRLLGEGGLVVFDDLWIRDVNWVVDLVLAQSDWRLRPDLAGPPDPWWKRAARRLRMRFHDPLDPDPAGLVAAQGNYNYCFLEKAAEESTWTYLRD